MRIKSALFATAIIAVSCMIVAPSVAHSSTDTAITRFTEGVTADADMPSAFTFSLTGPTPGPLTSPWQLGFVGVFAFSLLRRGRWNRTIRNKGMTRAGTSVPSTFGVAYSANDGRFSHWTARTSIAGTSAF